ncbi:MAG: 16S rRNA (guanine(966)-N(2))-methyltransferase RsmD [Armatimonadota bacterium]
MSHPAARRRATRPTRVRAHDALRPTAARVRDALFNSLGAAVDGAAVLDLFAGTGALGIEALHRGARRAVFVEADAARCKAIRAALRREELEHLAEVRCDDALAAVARFARAGEPFDLIVLDPPYGRGWLTRSLAAISAAGLVAPAGLIIAEGHWRDRPKLEPGLVVVKEARYGETALWFVRIEAG